MNEGTSRYRKIEREQNKESRKNEIIDTAKEMFLTNGYINTNMVDIANESKISRKTLYRYFKSKEEIALEIELRVFRLLSEAQDAITKQIEGNGHEKVSQYLNYLDKYFDRYTELIKFTGVFDYYFSGKYPDEAFTKEFTSLIKQTDQVFVLYIKEGINDGSITTNRDPVYLATTISNALLAMAQRLAARQRNVSQEHHINAREMLSIQVELFIKALKA